MLFVFIAAATMLSAAWSFNTDDAYITLRYSSHLAQGHGIVWNIGEAPPVEGYSNFLFVLLGALTIKMGWNPMLMFKLLDSAALAISCLLLYALTRLWLGPVGATIPALGLSSYVGTIWWTVSGLETAFYQMVVIGAVTSFFWGLGYRPVPEGEGPINRCEWSPYWIAWAGFFALIAGLTRPEGPLVAGSLIIALLAKGLMIPAKNSNFTGRERVKSIFRQVVILLAVFGLPYALYFSWRLSYFHRFFPNTVYCKAVYQGDPWHLLKSFGWLAWPYFFFALMGVRRLMDGRSLVILLILFFYTAILYGVDPLMGHLNRHFLAAFALLLVPASIGMVSSLRILLPKVNYFSSELAVALLMGAYLVIALPGNYSKLGHDAAAYAQRMATRAQVAAWLNRHLRIFDWRRGLGALPHPCQSNRCLLP